MKRWLLVVLALGCAPAFSTADNEYFTTSSGITGVTAGTGLTGGGTSGNVSIAVDQTQVILVPTGSASAPGIGIGETNTGFYNSGSHTLIYTTNGSGRLNLDANGVGNFNNSSASGMFFSGSDTTINSGNGLVKIVNGNTGASPFQVDTGSAKLTTISGAGGLSVTYNVSIGSFTITGAGAPPDSQALCLLSGKLGHCTTVVGATGGCTCSVP